MYRMNIWYIIYTYTIYIYIYMVPYIYIWYIIYIYILYIYIHICMYIIISIRSSSVLEEWWIRKMIQLLTGGGLNGHPTSGLWGRGPRGMVMHGWWWLISQFLVGGDWNMNFIFAYIGNNHPNWLSYFSEELKPPTRFFVCVLQIFCVCIADINTIHCQYATDIWNPIWY